MFFYKQFEEFDPLSSSLPAYPFTYLPEIAYRARSIVSAITQEKLLAMAQRIDSEIERYLKDLADTAISDLESRLSAGGEEFEMYFEWDGGNQHNGRWNFKIEMLDELDIPTEKNCDYVSSLKTIIEARDFCFFLPEGMPDPDPDEYPEGRDYELFATLSLWLVADALRFSNKGGKHGLSIAGDYAIKAMDAVCYAEQLREIDWQKGFQARTLAKMSDHPDDIRKGIQAEFELHEKEKKSARSKQLNTMRHAKTHDARELAVKDWEKAPYAFPSAEQAGGYYADWLETKGYKFTPRTVTGWIRIHAKEIGVKFR